MQAAPGMPSTGQEPVWSRGARCSSESPAGAATGMQTFSGRAHLPRLPLLLLLLLPVARQLPLAVAVLLARLGQLVGLGVSAPGPRVDGPLLLAHLQHTHLENSLTGSDTRQACSAATRCRMSCSVQTQARACCCLAIGCRDWKASQAKATATEVVSSSHRSSRGSSRQPCERTPRRSARVRAVHAHGYGGQAAGAPTIHVHVRLQEARLEDQNAAAAQAEAGEEEVLVPGYRLVALAREVQAQAAAHDAQAQHQGGVELHADQGEGRHRQGAAPPALAPAPGRAGQAGCEQASARAGSAAAGALGAAPGPGGLWHHVECSGKAPAPDSGGGWALDLRLASGLYEVDTRPPLRSIAAAMSSTAGALVHRPCRACFEACSPVRECGTFTAALHRARRQTAPASSWQARCS